MLTQAHASLVDYLPMRGLFVVMVIIVLLSFEGGFRVGAWKKRWPKQEQEVVARTMAGAMLGLLALMLAFTFGMAISRFDVRRQALVDETNAIRTTYLRANLLPEPQRAEIRRLLREYVELRLEAHQSRQFERAHELGEEWHARLWSEAIAAEEKTSSPVSAGHFIQSLNEMIGLSTKRIMIGFWFRIPDIIWIVLCVITALAVASIGYHAGLTGTSRSFVVLAFAVVFSAVMVLIVDIDRPPRWMLKASQDAFIDLRNMMAAPKR